VPPVRLSGSSLPRKACMPVAACDRHGNPVNIGRTCRILPRGRGKHRLQRLPRPVIEATRYMPRGRPVLYLNTTTPELILQIDTISPNSVGIGADLLLLDYGQSFERSDISCQHLASQNWLEC
jgi:hypothetical protein